MCIYVYYTQNVRGGPILFSPYVYIYIYIIALLHPMRCPNELFDNLLILLIHSQFVYIVYELSDYRSQPLLYGTNQRVDEFPHGLQAAVKETTEKMIGIPLPPPQVRQIEEKVRFRRPSEHEDRIRIATQHVQGYIR